MNLWSLNYYLNSSLKNSLLSTYHKRAAGWATTKYYLILYLKRIITLPS